MNFDINDNKNMNFVFYILLVITMIIVAFIDPAIHFYIRVFLLFFSVSALTIYLIFGNKLAAYSEFTYRLLQLFFFILATVFISCLLNNQHLMFFLFYLHQISLLFYMDKKILKLHTFEVICFIGILYLLGYFDILPAYQYTECIYFTIVLFINYWLLKNAINVINFQSRQFEEQERSLDDLLKVVESKCDEARQATKTKSTFLSNMSHEIRTPINAIIGMNEMILRESKDENITDYSINVENSSRMLLTLINDILDFSKIESGKMELIPVEYELRSILYDCVNMAQARAEKKGLDFQINANPDIPNCLLGDEVRIKQILTNLLTNAIKYTDEGSVSLNINYTSTDLQHIFLQISVADTGKGIRPEDKDKLFDTFQRVDQKNNRNVEGTGLGLPIAKSFVEMMQGTLTIDSTYGSGSTFTVEIPQRIIDSKPLGDIRAALRKRNVKKKEYHESFHAPTAKLLIVDDNSINLAVVTQLLKRTEINITTATSGAECLRLTSKEHFDVILLDHLMPELDGIETLHMLRKDPTNQCLSTPVIALTANAISGVKKMYLDAGFQDYLSKPITGELLEHTLKNYLPDDKVIVDQAEETFVSNVLIDTTLGLSFCGNKKDIYKDILRLFCNMKKNQISILNLAFFQRDWSQYASQLYELKSNTLNIGAKDLSDFVRTLEAAVKNIVSEEDSDAQLIFLKKNHEMFLEQFNEVYLECEKLLDTL